MAKIGALKAWAGKGVQSVEDKKAEQAATANEMRRWPMSESARAIHETAVTTLDTARAKWEAAQEVYQALLIRAMKMDDLPAIGAGPGEIQGIGREGDEWVEVSNQPRR